MDYGKHILVVMMIFTSLLLLVVSSSFSADHSLKYETLIPTSLPARETVEEALSRHTESESESSSSRRRGRFEFSVNLYHVDSLSLAGTTSETLFKNRLSRDARRAKRMFASPGKFISPVISGIQWDCGEYFAIIGVGSLSTDFYMVMDTGSDLTWLQCRPCKNCYKQVGPIFNPNTSSSFYRVPCKSKICGGDNDPSGYCNKHNNCPYSMSYGDGSFSSGEIATETLTFEKKAEVRDVILGCGHNNTGLFVAAAGLLGLGRDESSFPSQAGSKFGNTFSYCLASRVASPGPSSLVFGSSAYGKAAVVYTPLLTNPNTNFNTFYYVGLEGISVGGSRVKGIDASTFSIDKNNGGGGVIIDSGTSVTRLPKSAYKALRDAFKSEASNLKLAASSKTSLFDTCYDMSRMGKVSVPAVVMHFQGGVDLPLPAMNYLITVDDNGTVCFGFAGTQPDGGLTVIGNFLQQSIGVVFDSANNRVGFVEKACS